MPLYIANNFCYDIIS